MGIILASVLVLTISLVISKRIAEIINIFALQSFLLFLMTFIEAVREKSPELFFVSLLIISLKVFTLPVFLRKVISDIKVDEKLGFYLSPMLSLFFMLFLAYLSYVFAGKVIGFSSFEKLAPFAVSLTVILTGLFIMVFRVKALTQIIGLLVIENGLFIAAVTMCGRMPFIIEIAIFFDIFLCVIILGIFLYRINTLFTHIDLDKMNRLKG